MEKDKNARNVCNGEEDEEDEKMEQFFALIKSFREARNRRRCELEEEGKKKMRKLGEERSSWVPSFRWEDFTEEVEFRRLPVIFPIPCNNKKKQDNKKKEEEEEEEDDRVGLNLKLTL